MTPGAPSAGAAGAPIWASNCADALPHLQRGNRVDGDIPRQRLGARSKCLPTRQGIRWRLAVRQGTAVNGSAVVTFRFIGQRHVRRLRPGGLLCRFTGGIAFRLFQQRRIGRLRPGIFRCRIAAGVTLRLFRRRRVRGLHIIGLAQLPYL